MSVIYSMILTIGNPNDEGRVLDLRDKEGEVKEAINYFNQEAMGQKLITGLHLDAHHIYLVLEFKHFITGVSARHLVKFSQYLASKKGWAEKYSKDASKLFRLVSANRQITEDVTSTEVASHVSESKQSYEVDSEQPSDECMTDDESLIALKTLLSTKNIGSQTIKKHAAIREIKKILHDTV